MEACRTWWQQRFSCGRPEALLKAHDAESKFFDTKYDLFSQKVHSTQTNGLKVAQTKAYPATARRCSLTLVLGALGTRSGLLASPAACGSCLMLPAAPLLLLNIPTWARICGVLSVSPLRYASCWHFPAVYSPLSLLHNWLLTMELDLRSQADAIIRQNNLGTKERIFQAQRGTWY